MKTSIRFLLRLIALSCFCFWLTLRPLYAQMRVGQPAGSPDPSAALDVSGGPYANGSMYRGIAPPKVALTQSTVAAPVDKPATGLLIYNTAKAGDVIPGYYYWEGDKWLRFTTTSAGAARVAAVNGQSIPAYLISQLAGLTTPPDIIYIADQGRPGMFRYMSGSTGTDDGSLILTTTGGRYQRIITDGLITPQMFGAVGDNLTDDGAALLAWLNVAGYKHTLPQGKYRSSIELTRNNKGSLTLEGAGGDKSEIIFTGNTNGLRIINPLAQADSTNRRSIRITGLRITSAGAKTNKEALYVESGHFQRPGIFLEDITVSSYVAANQWKTETHIRNSSNTTIRRYVQTAPTRDVTTAILLDNDENYPTVETVLHDISIQQARTGIRAEGYSTPNTHNPAIEAIQLDQSHIIGVDSGIVIKNHGYFIGLPVGAGPYFVITGTHINSFGGPCVYIKSCSQIFFGQGNLWYANPNQTTLISPTHAVVLAPYLLGRFSEKVVS